MGITKIGLMGNETPKAERPVFNRINYEIVCSKVQSHTELARNRKITELEKGEGKLKELFNAKNQNWAGITAQAHECIGLLGFAQGGNIVLRSIKTLKDQGLTIEDLHQNNKPLGELEPAVYNVVWATKRLNLTVIQEFNNLVKLYFDPNIFTTVEESQKVDLNLKKKFKT